MLSTSINPETLPPITHNQIPVITTELLAQLYGTQTNNIKVNFTRNADRFVEGKHFFKLEGDGLREMKHRVTQSNSVKIARNVRSLTLWTERGAARHAKMLETDQAWEVFEKLEDCYFAHKPTRYPRNAEVLGDLVGTATTMNVRDARRGKQETDKRVATRIAEKCVPVILKEMREQYHYSNCDIGPEEVIPALLQDGGQMQLRTLMRELTSNGNDVSGAWRELEAIRYYLHEQLRKMSDIASHSNYISQLASE